MRRDIIRLKTAVQCCAIARRYKRTSMRFFFALQEKMKGTQRLPGSFFGAADETKSEPEAPASVTCLSMNFTRWSSENSQYICQPILWASTTNWNLDYKGLCKYTISTNCIPHS